MSRKISNILVICALVVIFPLLIVGSAFAAYYSINASVNVGIYTGLYTSQSASAAVVYNSKANTETFEVSGSHARVITLKANATGYTFKGWFNGTKQKYLEAELADDVKYFNTENELKVKLSDYENILAVYEINPFTITYKVGDTTTSQTTKGTTTLQDPAQAAQDAGLTNLQDGKKWAWVKDGNVITTAEEDITVTLTQVAVEYTITVAGGEGISYTGSAVKANYESEATALNAIFNAENYTTTLEFKSFGSKVVYGSTVCTTTAELLAAIKAANKTTDATITVTPVVNNTFDNIKITTLKYRQGRLLPSGIYVYDQAVYTVNGIEYGNSISGYEEVSTSTLVEAFSLGAGYTDVDGIDLTYTSVTFMINGNTFDYKGGQNTTINDVLNAAYKVYGSAMGDGETFIFEEAIIKFII